MIEYYLVYIRYVYLYQSLENTIRTSIIASESSRVNLSLQGKNAPAIQIHIVNGPRYPQEISKHLNLVTNNLFSSVRSL